MISNNGGPMSAMQQRRNQLLNNDIGDIDVTQEPMINEFNDNNTNGRSPQSYRQQMPQQQQQFMQQQYMQQLQYMNQQQMNQPQRQQQMNYNSRKASPPKLEPQENRSNSLTSNSFSNFLKGKNNLHLNFGKKNHSGSSGSNQFSFLSSVTGSGGGGAGGDDGGKDDDEVIMDDNDIYTFGDIPGMRHRKDILGTSTDSTPIIPTILTKKDPNDTSHMSNTEYRKFLTNQRKMNYNNFSKQLQNNNKNNNSNNNMPPRAMSLQTNPQGQINGMNPFQQNMMMQQQQRGMYASNTVPNSSMTSPTHPTFNDPNMNMNGNDIRTMSLQNGNRPIFNNNGAMNSRNSFQNNMNMNNPRTTSIQNVPRPNMNNMPNNQTPNGNGPRTMSLQNSQRPKPMQMMVQSGSTNNIPTISHLQQERDANNYTPDSSQSNNLRNGMNNNNNNSLLSRSDLDHLNNIQPNSAPSSTSSLGIKSNSTHMHNNSDTTNNIEDISHSHENSILHNINNDDSKSNNSSSLNTDNSMLSNEKGKLNVLKLSEPQQQEEIKEKELLLAKREKEILEKEKLMQQKELEVQKDIIKQQRELLEKQMEINNQNMKNMELNQQASRDLSPREPTRPSIRSSMVSYVSDTSDSSQPKKSGMYMLENSTDLNAFSTAQEFQPTTQNGTGRKQSQDVSHPPDISSLASQSTFGTVRNQEEDLTNTRTISAQRNSISSTNSRTPSTDSIVKLSDRSFSQSKEDFKSTSSPLGNKPVSTKFADNLRIAKVPSRKREDENADDDDGAFQYKLSNLKDESNAQSPKKDIQKRLSACEKAQGRRRSELLLAENTIHEEKEEAIKAQNIEIGVNHSEDDFSFDNTLQKTYIPSFANDGNISPISSFKTITISAEQFHILEENKTLMNEIKLLSTELAESVRRETYMEEKFEMLSSTKGFKITDVKSEFSIVDFENELKKKSSKIVELIQQLNTERMKRFVAEEQVLLQENGCKPASITLVNEINRLKREIQAKDEAIRQLTSNKQ
ncbi:hypothetical protein TBLA_0B09280 [Henningerozyma blattae CBS 6284]|uniref:Uncharacterized protein n=1 Tax=Henningerozyma blattae (strain ATCC 34711 / CBS 6284 / DSM 70876 / NBRC 10599 / NRRL Y-10934 / UCD 77-7) TaxID=1071380 RepID=I2H043_HENB6|nr:hypothetical protein TBLA_0B09280 [Tetrapisispora blattae CBS 6284]CCH59745.1 hypothetical protein TBLA_0B09280 [Tetrapisispora blattae CBS 6284]